MVAREYDFADIMCQFLQFQQHVVIPQFEPDHRFTSYGAGTGPIYLSQLNCDGSEAKLLDCETLADATGIHNCDHKDDIGVQCQGNTNP